MRMKFKDVFKEHPDGALSPIKQIRIGGCRIGTGVKFSNPTTIGGVSIFDYLGSDIEVGRDLWGGYFLAGFYGEKRIRKRVT